MATWISRLIVKWSADMGADYAACENSWSYNTTSDHLTVHTRYGEYSDYGGVKPAHTKSDHFQQSEALALLKTLMDWAETFEGEGTVEGILHDIRKEKEKL